jgi:hypothetical protein
MMDADGSGSVDIKELNKHFKRAIDSKIEDMQAKGTHVTDDEKAEIPGMIQSLSKNLTDRVDGPSGDKKLSMDEWRTFYAELIDTVEDDDLPEKRDINNYLRLFGTSS